MTKHFCDICKQPALDTLNVEFISNHGEVSILAKVRFCIFPLDVELFPLGVEPLPPDLCDKCLATILENLHKKYTAAG